MAIIDPPESLSKPSEGVLKASELVPSSQVEEWGSRSDSELVMAVAQRRSKSAFAEIFNRYASKLKFFIIRLGADPNGADEVVQEAMLLVWRRAETFDPEKASLSTWLFTIARNKRISIVRKKQLPAPDPEDPAFEPSVEPMQEQHIEASEQQALIRGALDNLPSDQVEIIKMSFFEGKSHQVIAETLCIPLGTVKSRARLALGKLRKVVEGKTDGS